MDISIKWHAALMIFGWISCVTSGLFVARFAKPFWPKHRIFGFQIWFMAHQVFMIIGWAAIVASLIIIYVKVGRFTTSTHAMIGHFSGVLATIQIFNSFFRPLPDSKYRWIFNYFHWALGMIAHLLALYNITKSFFNRSPAFMMLTMIYIFLYISLSDLFRKLDPLLEKSSHIVKSFFITGVLIINIISIAMIINICRL